MQRIILPALAIILSAAPHAQAQTNTGAKINPQDAAEMIYIPAGEFTMGSDDDQADERPAHKVELDGYWIYKHPVTVAQYRKFCAQTGHSMPEAPWFDWNNSHPVVNITWQDAMAYAQWAGGALPTEAQWEKAARGTSTRKYPWGNDWSADKCNGMGRLGKTTAVGSYLSGVSPYGAHDMAGNVWEWCSDWYDATYYQHSPQRNPAGPQSGVFRVRRGGAWNYDGADYRCANRNCLDPGYAAYFDPNMGFRVAQK